MSKKTALEIANDKANKIMEIVAWRCAYYRANPHRFVKEVLGLNLKLFQQILIYAMMKYDHIMYLAARGQGKTYLTALFAVVRCILYPGTKICIASKTRTQANEVLLKIQDDFMKHSPILCTEIEEITVNSNKGICMFKNGSWIRVVTANDNGRSARANILICDEFRMVDEIIIINVLKKFLTSPRHPLYLDKPEYKGLSEDNKEIYMSSAWYYGHWSYKKAQAFTVSFFDDKKKYFICGLPYQISIMEGLLKRSQIEDEMSEADFSELNFSMEMECLWFGDTNGSFFTYEDINKQRKIKDVFLPLEKYGSKNKIPDLLDGERRILSIDVALMSSNKNKNDTSAITINRNLAASNRSTISNVVYIETFEGLNTDELGLYVMRFFYEYKCTDLVLDTNGVGMGVYDFIIKDQYDPTTGKIYNGLSCCNSDEMADRCKIKNAPKVIWSIKATGNFNNESCILLRNAFKNGKINIPISEFDAPEYLKDHIKGYNTMKQKDRDSYMKVYAQSSMAVNELINLDSETKGTNIKVKEKPGNRKDRYSSICYSYWVACQLEIQNKPKIVTTQSLIEKIKFVKQKVGYAIE